MSLLHRKLKFLKLDTKYFVVQGGWTTIHFFASSVLSFLVQILVVNSLSKESYGQYQYAFAISGAIMSFSLQGLRVEMIAQISRGELASFPSTMKILEKFSILLFLGHFAVAAYYYYIENFDQVWLLIILGISAPATTIYNTYSGYLQGIKDFKTNAYYQLLSLFVTCLLTALSIFLSKNIIILALLSQGSGVLANFVINRKVLKRLGPIQPSKEVEKKLIQNGAHYSVAGILGSIGQYFDKIILSHFAGMVDVAALAVASSLGNRAKLFAKSTTTTFLPKIAEKNLVSIKGSFYLRTFQTLVIGLLASLALYIVTPFIFNLVYPKYSDSSFYAQLLSFEIVFLFVGNYHGTIMKGHGMVRPLYLLTTVTGLVRLFLLFVGCYLMGLRGIVFARILTNCFGFTLGFAILMHKFKSIKSRRSE